MTARSRLTGAPTARAPSADRSRVSPMTSAVNSPSRIFDHGETDAVDGDRGAVLRVAGDQRAADTEPGRIVGQELDRDDLAELLNDAGEHLLDLHGADGTGDEPDVRPDRVDLVQP